MAQEADTGDEVSRFLPPEGVEYRGIETRLLDGDLVQFLVELGPSANHVHVERYAECAAAQYALIRGYGFARHVRTTVDQKETGWQGDAVYTISPSLPRGLKTIDAEVVAGNCAENGIPMV
ncbi:hypothetical protein RXV86_16740 [Alisedimentitalea sp. MJ-SS2]|uniref:hypothetical protein n=1 Tax=Aliisedimentitalea sp. MJ-SS2 TaxID=3049795 RepID=UPI00290A17F0|nr:hypothetical protein [Alisedimentitalea sp. MJ-SS2]MDU8929043.1 hypothetical protein [Alisedimentitalea sp. MJ-SS2]